MLRLKVCRVLICGTCEEWFEKHWICTSVSMRVICWLRSFILVMWIVDQVPNHATTWNVP